MSKYFQFQLSKEINFSPLGVKENFINKTDTGGL